MKTVLLSFCLIAAAFSAPTTLDLSRVSNLEGDVAATILHTIDRDGGTEALPTEARHENGAAVILPNCGCFFRAHHARS